MEVIAFVGSVAHWRFIYPRAAGGFSNVPCVFTPATSETQDADQKHLVD